MKLRRLSVLRRIPRAGWLLLLAVMLLASISLPLKTWAADTRRDPIWGGIVKDPPAWLSRPGELSALYSEYDLDLLAGHLIVYGAVDASACPNSGLLPTGEADKCGLKAARPEMHAWQNQFNSSILGASQRTGVPPFMMKNIFAWESQFWPTMVYINTSEYGFGHLTEMGADSVLRWNEPFYAEICAKGFAAETCKNRIYEDQPPEIRAALRGLVIQQVRADCATCAFGLDLSVAKRSTGVFAQVLLANARFVRDAVHDATGKSAADVLTYEDFWKFTLASYNAGPGCLSDGLSRLTRSGTVLNWKNLAAQLQPACRGAVPYVKFVSNTSAYHPGDDPGAQPTPTGTPLTVTETSTAETATPAASQTPTPMGDNTGTPAPSETPTGTIESSSTPATSETPPETPSESGTPEGSPTLQVDETPTGTLTETPAGSETVAATAEPTMTGEISGFTPTPLATDTPTPSESSSPVVTATEPPVSETPPVEPSPLPPDEHSPDQIVVKFKGFPASIFDSAVLGLVGAEKERELPELGALLVKVPPQALARVLERLQGNLLVDYAELNYGARAFYTPMDPLYPGQQPYLDQIQVPAAWDISSGQGVVVAVVDTGVESIHPDLGANIWQNPDENGTDASGNDKRSNGVDDDGNGYVDDWQGWNFVGGNNAPADDNGHGTHLASIIAAGMDNEEGMAGVAPRAQVMALKALDGDGYGTYADVAQAILYAVNNGARIINLGFGGTADSQALRYATNYAYTHGALVVAAAGNSGDEATYYPAANPDVVAVSAVDADQNLAPFSTYGKAVSLAAPGIDINAAGPGGQYGQFSGTSMSAAEVSGAAALLASLPQFPTASELREALLGSAFDLGAPGQDIYFGNGLIHALDALNYVPGFGTATPSPSPTATGTSPSNDTGGGVWIMSPLDLWGSAQVGSSCSITDPGNSIDLAFNDSLASCVTSASGYWAYTSITDASFGPVGQVVLEARFYTSAWPDGTLTIQVSNNNGNSYTTVATYSSTTLPPSSLTTVSLDVSTYFTSQAQLNNAQVLLNWTATGTARTIYVDEVRLRVTLGANPTPTLPPPGPLQPVAPDNPHGGYTATTDKCAACHADHTAAGPGVLNSAWPEENVCFACHKSGGSGTNIQPAFTSYTNTATRFFKHDVTMNAGVHQGGEDTGISFGGGERHIECADCHNSHAAGRDAIYGTTGAPFAQPEMRLISGVDPTWTAAGSPFVFGWLTEAGREAQICFKCHTSFTTLPRYQPDGWNGAAYVANGLKKLTSTAVNQVVDTRDMAEAFNPYNASYHPVVAPGRNTVMPDSFVTGLGLSTSSMIRCSDCHTNGNPASGARGPHGSPLLHLLDGTNDYTTVESGNALGAGEVCFKCHRQDVYGPTAGDATANLTRFHNNGTNLHARHVADDRTSCYACHNSHGSQQLRLINFDVTVAFPAPGYNSVTSWQFNGVTASCSISCHSTVHSVTENTYTP